MVVATGGTTVFVAGQEPEDEHGNLVGPGGHGGPGTPGLRQPEPRSCRRGRRPEHVARITIFVVRHQSEHLPVIEAARASVFGDHKPADTPVGVPWLAGPARELGQ